MPKSQFKLSSDEGGGGSAQVPEISWVAADANPWGVPVLDLRPVALGMLSTSKDMRCATNAMSFQQDDGLGFIGVEPEGSDTVRTNLRFRIERILADGALFIPSEMEHKWALYYHRGQILCIRSWLRTVAAVADVRTAGEYATDPLFAWARLEAHPQLATLRQLREILLDQQRLDGLEQARGRGRIDFQAARARCLP